MTISLGKVRLVASMIGLLVAVAASTGCGGRQTPPAEGSCHPWREWVPPARDANGQWQDGYCRDRPGATPGQS